LRATLLFSRVPVWTEATAVHAVVIPSGECRFAYGDTELVASLEYKVEGVMPLIALFTSRSIFLVLPVASFFIRRMIGSTVSGFTVLNTKEAIVNIQRKALGLKPHDRYNLFDKHGELDPNVLIKSLG
jgi:hypothetical protein